MLRFAIGYALVNKPESIKDHYKIDINYSDHSMIYIDMNIYTKLKKHIYTTHGRDFRKLRSNPKFFLKQLANINWETFKDMDDVYDME